MKKEGKKKKKTRKERENTRLCDLSATSTKRDNGRLP